MIALGSGGNYGVYDDLTGESHICVLEIIPVSLPNTGEGLANAFHLPESPGNSKDKLEAAPKGF